MAVWKRFWRDEGAAELVEFALVLPLLFGVLWMAFQAWELTTVRSAMRSTTAQVARYMNSFIALQYDGQPYPDLPALDSLCGGAGGDVGVDTLVRRTLTERYLSNVGQSLNPQLRYYWVQDPTNPNAAGNWQGPLDCASFLAAIDAQAMACQREETPQSPRPRIQFVVEMVVEVPWRTLILGRFDRPVSDETVAITLMERAVGNITCPPRCVMETAELITIQPAGAGHCLVTLWVRYPRYKCSFIPGRVIAEVNHVRYFDTRPVVGSEEFRQSFVVGSGSQIDVWISPDNDQTGPYSLHVGPVTAVCP